MTQNLITSAFELVRDVEHGVLLLDTFHRLASREVRHPHLEGLPTGTSSHLAQPLTSSLPLSNSLASTSVKSVGVRGSSGMRDQGNPRVSLLPRPSCEPMRRRLSISTCCSIVS